MARPDGISVVSGEELSGMEDLENLESRSGGSGRSSSSSSSSSRGGGRAADAMPSAKKIQMAVKKQLKRQANERGM